jgi:[amino group carrier protein]-lysine/ornithine hydrolase
MPRLPDSDKTSLLEGLLSAYSPTGLEEIAVDYLVSRMKTLGFQANRDVAGNAVGVLGDGPNQIVLLGHIDTVPGIIPVRYEDDALYGRGSVAAKGPLACFTAAAGSASIGPGWQVIVIGAVAEEGDSHGARYIIDHYHPQMVVIGEPSSWDHITLGYKGSLWAKYSLQRPMAHTSARQQSSCEGAVDYWNRLQAEADFYNSTRPKVFDQLTPTLRMMNSSFDGFSEKAEITIGLRLPPEMGIDQTGSLLKRLVQDGLLSLEDGAIPAFRTDKNNALVRAFLAAIRLHGGTPGFLVKSGTADMNIVGPVWNSPILAYGPGDSSLDHTPEEHISIIEYLRGINVLTSVLERVTADSDQK